VADTRLGVSDGLDASAFMSKLKDEGGCVCEGEVCRAKFVCAGCIPPLLVQYGIGQRKGHSLWAVIGEEVGYDRRLMLLSLHLVVFVHSSLSIQLGVHLPILRRRCIRRHCGER
jgi:hypothetical protein